ncbi:hypothetical protein [Lachnoclostridium sp. Marseille-P6806]|uniref:hypothetical protein n=1 Tax=Lachnoclostridium sp. Marseille-P6806 TaxID=2364793 RepID=UPI00102F9E45|nr:hypothetical protein [Lachnoclostridium sp. Marseille-P6806]
MEPNIAIIIGIIVTAAIIAVVLYKRKSPPIPDKSSNGQDKTDLTIAGIDAVAQNRQTDLAVRFEDLPALTETEEAALVEIKDQKLLARIDSAVPGTLQAVANAGVIHQYQQVVQNAGQLYQAIIPNDAVLADSKAMQGAVRGIYHGADGIQGHANLVAVDGNMGSGLAAMNVANAAMGAAAMVVGQYYMTQINDQFDQINGELDKIATFQDKEYQSKIYALVAEV